MTMKRIALVFALATVFAAAPLSSVPVAAAAETQVSAAAAGVFPDGATFNGIPLQGSTFGIGVVVYPDGTATGDFEIVLAGTSALGQPQEITLVGKGSAGTANPDGSVSFSGAATLDMGGGSLPGSVPFPAVGPTPGPAAPIGARALP